MTFYLGIDPGAKGAACIHDTVGESFYFVDWCDDSASIWDELENCCHPVGLKIIKFAIIEKATAMPKQGVSSMFTFGMNYGKWLALLEIAEIPYEKQSPIKWRKGLLSKQDGKDTKTQVKNVCCKRFPKYKDELFGPKGGYKDGRGDAMLIAYKAFLQNTGGI